MKSNRTIISMVFLIISVILCSNLYALDADMIIEKVDSFRIYSEDGFAFDMNVIDNEDESSLLRIYVNEYDESLCAYQGEDRGTYILLKDNSFWFYDSDMNSPIRLSERQLLVGQASSGDITRIVFAELYDITNSEETENEYILYLTAKSNEGATYDSIKLYVNKENLKPIKAECFSRTDIMLKTIYYKEFDKIDGRDLLTGFEIVNELSKESSYVNLSNFNEEKLPSNYFNKNYMRYLRLH